MHISAIMQDKPVHRQKDTFDQQCMLQQLAATVLLLDHLLALQQVL